MQSCGKEELHQGARTETYDPTPQILSFLNDVQRSRNGMPKNNQGFSADSAVWYLEAGLNYTLGNLGLDYNMSVVDTVSVPLIFGEQQTSAGVVYDAFDALVVLLAPMVTEEQHIILVDVVEPPPGACEVLALVSIGSDYTKAAPNTVYGVKDCYYYGGGTAPSLACACGCSTNLTSGSYCANIIIQNRINAANLIALTGNQYVTSVETWRIWNFDQIPQRYISLYNPLLSQAPVGDGYHDTKPYSHYINGASGGTIASLLCLSPSEMSYWTGNATSGTWSAILAIKNTYCPTKTFLGCTIVQALSGIPVFSQTPYPSATGTVYWHMSSYRYGVIVTPGTGG